MSLIDSMMTDCVIMEKTRVPDGAGGSTVTWNEGLTFGAAITLNTTLEARVAEQQGVTSVYTVTTRKGMMLDYGDIFKRIDDGQVFRCTSNGNDKKTPRTSSLDFSQVNAEKWELTK